jgi:ribosomal protein L7Ae-like RNA K-turn-binding protein
VKPRSEVDALGLLGLAHRAGALLRGVDATRRGLDAGEVGLVILAADASEGQLDKVRGILEHRDVPLRWVSGRTVLGRALGQAALSAVGVKDRSFAEQLLKRLPRKPSKGSEVGEPGKPQEEPSRDAGC